MKEFKPFRLDPINHALLRMTEQEEAIPVAITAKTFDVLRYFVDHPGRLITHEELLEALWAGVAVMPEVLKGHVLAIRTALDDDARRPRYVETHRGRGYRFIAAVENVAKNGHDGSVSGVSLVGREESSTKLRLAFESASAGKPQIVFVRGEAGIGKTALVESFCKDLGEQSALMSYGRCIEGFGGIEPFYSVIEALARWAKEAQGGRIQDALLSHAPSWGSLLGGTLTRDRRAILLRSQNLSVKSRVLGEFCDLLEFIAESSPVLVWLEDVHWADYSTLDLISALARRQSRSPIMLVCTMRSDDVSERSHALKQLMDDLQLHHLCSVIDLEGLEDKDIACYIGSTSSGQSMDLVTSLSRRSGGNPLFLGIILDHLRSTAVLTHVDGQWTYQAPTATVAMEIPPTINELVESRIAHIDDESRRALEAASAVGDSFNAIVPAGAAGLGVRRFEELCEKLCRSGTFIRRQRMDMSATGEQIWIYKFKHSLYREVFLARQGPLQLAQSHALIAKELESSYEEDGESHVPFELAEQFSNAHDWSKAISYLKIALQTAKRRFAHQDALTILDKADRVALNVPEGKRAHVQAELMEDRASIYAANHDKRALDVFARLAEVAEELGRTDIQARAELGRGFVLSWTDASASVAHLEAAHRLSYGQPNPQLRARIRLASAAWRIWIAGWKPDLSETCDTNLRPLRNGDDRQITAWGLIQYSMVCLVSSRYREALETMEGNVDILVRHAIDRPEFNVFRAIWMAHLGRPWAYILLGEWGRALAEFDASEALFVANANRYSTCTLETLRGFLFLLAGDYQGVRDVCVKLGFYKDQAKESHHPLYTLVITNEIRHCTLLAGAADTGLGREEEGIESLIKLHQEMSERPVVMDWYWQFLLLWILADALVKVGRAEEAREYADKLIRLLDATQDGTWKTFAFELRARIAVKQGDLEGGVYFLERGLGVIEAIGAPIAEWRIHRIASELYRARGNSELASRHDRLFQETAQCLLDSLPKGHRLTETFRRSLL